MKKLVLLGLTVTTALAFAAVAIAQYSAPATVDLTGSIKPKKAGTKAKPANGKVNLKFVVNEESNTTIDRITYTLDKDVKLNGKGFPTCSVDFLATNPVSACPKKSRIGKGSAKALLGPSKTPLDFVVTVLVGGPKKITLYLDTNLFDIPIEGTLKGRKLDIPLPERVYRPVAGLYAYVTEVDATIGKAAIKKKKGKKKKTVPYVSIKGCTGGNHSYKVDLHAIPNPNPPAAENLSDSGSSKCKAAKKKKKGKKKK